MGVKVYLFGGTASAFAHYVRWDLEREAGDVLCLIDFLLGTPYSRSCEALSDVQLLIVPQENLVAMLEAADNVMAMMMKATAARIAAKQQGAPA